MSVLRQLDQTNVITAQTITTTTETVVVTGPNLVTPKDVWFAVVLWYVQITLGTGTTSLTVRVRKNSLTGAIVGNPQALTVTASNVAAFSGQAVDTGSFTASTLYVVTVQQGAATGNATVNEAVLTALTF